MSTLPLPRDLCQQTHPVLSVSSLAHGANRDDSEPVWTTRIRIGSSHFVVLATDGRIHALLSGELPETDDIEALNLRAWNAAEDWLKHTRSPIKRRPLFPVRRLPRPSRVDGDAVRYQQRGDVAT